MRPDHIDVTVTCLNCGGQSRLKIINGREVFYVDHTPIIACRLRGDMEWGFECICGNDSRLAPSEREDAEILVQGGPHALEKLIDSLKVKDEKKFKMVEA